MRSPFFLLLAILLSPLHAFSQNDFNTYPIRPLISIIEDHNTVESSKVDFVVSAAPFPSKTAVVVTGQHRPISKPKMDFIKLWFEVKNAPLDRLNEFENEYLFKEGDKDYWLPVLKPIEPYMEKELNKGDMTVLYYFFIGSYSKTLREWVFVVEEFHKVETK